MIYKFSKMRDKKLESLRKVKDYIAFKMRNKVLVALKQNADDCLEKDAHVKKALQFQLLRHNRFYLLMRGYKALHCWPRLKQ